MTSALCRLFSASVCATLLGGRALAVLAPEFYEEARRSAPNHVQIEIEDVSGPSGGMGPCEVEGRVVNVFRGTLTPGARLDFTVSCYDYGEIPAGPTLWTDYDALKDAKYLEAFMSADAQPRIALDQVEIIMSPRDRPYCDSETLYCESVGVSSKAADCDGGWRWLGLGGDDCD